MFACNSVMFIISNSVESHLSESLKSYSKTGVLILNKNSWKLLRPIFMRIQSKSRSSHNISMPDLRIKSLWSVKRVEILINYFLVHRVPYGVGSF